MNNIDLLVLRLTKFDEDNIRLLGGITGLDRSKIVRKSLHLAHFLCRRCSESGPLVLRNELLMQQEDIYLGPSSRAPDDREPRQASSKMFQLRLVDHEAENIEALEHIAFASNRSAIVRRSLALTRQVLVRLRAGWECGYFENDSFHAIPVLDNIHLHLVQEHTAVGRTIAALTRSLSLLSPHLSRPEVVALSERGHDICRQYSQHGEISTKQLKDLREACIDSATDLLSPSTKVDKDLILIIAALEDLLLTIKAVDTTHALIPSMDPSLILHSLMSDREDRERAEIQRTIEKKIDGTSDKPRLWDKTDWEPESAERIN